MNHTILSLQAKKFLLVLKNLEELIFNMAHIVDKTVFGFSITFMMLFAIPIFFGTDSIFSTSMPPVLALAIYNFTSTTVSFILLSVNIFATSNHILNLTLRVIWTVLQGIAVIILTLQAISPGLIYGEPKIDHSIVIIINHLIWIPGLLIIIPMFIYGIREPQ